MKLFSLLSSSSSIISTPGLKYHEMFNFLRNSMMISTCDWHDNFRASGSNSPQINTLAEIMQYRSSNFLAFHIFEKYIIKKVNQLDIPHTSETKFS